MLTTDIVAFFWSIMQQYVLFLSYPLLEIACQYQGILGLPVCVQVNTTPEHGRGDRGEPVESTEVISEFETHVASMEDAPNYD